VKSFLQPITCPHCLVLCGCFVFSGWICVSLCEFHTVVVQPGEEVTLQCSNLSRFPAHLYWFKLNNGPNISSISSMLTFKSNVSLYEGFQHDKFIMTSNITKVFLHISQVHPSDNGLYFCGVKNDLTPGVFTATYLQVKGKRNLVCLVDAIDVIDEPTNLLNVILGGVVILLVMIIISLVVKIRSFYASTYISFIVKMEICCVSDSLSFCPKAESNRRHVAEREMQTNVLYAAPR
uniref:Ig-like domain-containing protein n=1 Tax=Kryptolebias marmoratus TaxID=37003 RepID=A0A3Q3GHW5_KRYMA